MSADEASGSTCAVRGGLALRLGCHHVLGEFDVGGSWLLRLGDLEGLTNYLRDDGGVAHARVPFRDGAHEGEDVDVLVRLLVHPFQIALAGENDDGRAVEEGVRHAGHEVGGAWAECCQAHPGPPRQAPVGVGHVRGRLFVSYRNEPDRRARQRLVEVEGLLSGHAEDAFDALGLQA